MSLLSPQLNAFFMIAKHKTMHAAAEAMHLTQTALTQRIKSLEKSLGASVFTRTRRGMQLTPEGEALLRYCQAASALEGETMAKIKGAGVETEVQICISGPTSLMHARIIPQCLSVMQQYQNLLLQFDINDRENRHQTLKAGSCDFAILQQEDLAQEMVHKALKPEQYVLVCSPKWQDRNLNDIINKERIIDYNPSDQMTFNYLKHFDLFEARKQGRHFANRTESIALLVMNGFGYSVMTKEFVQPYVDQQQLMLLNQGKTYLNTPLLAWYERPEPPTYFAKLIAAIT